MSVRNIVHSTYFRSLSIVFTAYCLLLTACCSNGFAGTISITTQATARVEGGSLHVVLLVTNRGNAAARQVRADAEVLGERFVSQAQTRIEPGESQKFDFSKPLGRTLLGTFPLKVLVHFQDSTGYPFSALTCTTFSVGENRNAGLASTSDPLSIKDEGFVRFRIQNKSSQAKHITATLVLPRELFCEEEWMSFIIQAGGNRTLSFPIRNLGAIYGATYPIFLVQRFESNGVTHTTISNALVNIAYEGNWFRRTRWHWAGGFILAGAFLIFGAVRVKNQKVFDISSKTPIM